MNIGEILFVFKEVRAFDGQRERATNSGLFGLVWFGILYYWGRRVACAAHSSTT